MSDKHYFEILKELKKPKFPPVLSSILIFYSVTGMYLAVILVIQETNHSMLSSVDVKHLMMIIKYNFIFLVCTIAYMVMSYGFDKVNYKEWLKNND